ncbi:MAG: lactate utilization protein C [Actinobacteria bacterium HGW-Actinobacteria-4]|nr:MAG: lactate utilization protein C [Actinobacteria bacterium HGW-Actinobacteria-4]
MSDRDQILGDVRRALARASAASEIPRGYREVGPPVDAKALFVSRAQDYGVTVTECVAAAVASTLGQLTKGLAVVVPPSLPWPVPEAVVDDHLTPRELDSFDVVVTASALAVAATGTVVLDHSPGQGRRAVSLVPDMHVCVVWASSIVADVPDAIARLSPERPQTWISGPSATSDIELQRVQGVHGPRTLHLVLVTDE